MRADGTYINEETQIVCVGNYLFVCFVHFVFKLYLYHVT